MSVGARADTTCPPSPTVPTVTGDLIVQSGQTCTLLTVTVTGNVQVKANATLQTNPGTNTTIGGNLLVGAGATLSAFGHLNVGGTVQADNCNEVVMTGTNVGSNVIIRNCAGSGGGLQIGGNFECSDDSFCGLNVSIVNGNVQINRNRFALIEANTIVGNLQCGDNASITDRGNPNAVGGSKLGQCAGF
jgi:hypothetical protein